MQIISDIRKFQKITAQLNRTDKSIGFVPTMGALHIGHTSLIKESKAKNDITIVSIFVNPTQFAPHEDLTKYPRPFEKDKTLLNSEGVDYLFFPSLKSVYPPDYKTYITVKGLSDILEGKSRPGHFTGVATIVLKLLHIVQPTNTYFGQKDLQQCIIVRKLIKDLDFPVNFHIMPIIRESDGLALSSRNIYLNEKERKSALCLSQSLKLAKKLISGGEKDVDIIKKNMKKLIENYPEITIDYVAICDAQELLPLKKIDKKTAILVAVYVGKTRLIDNIIV